MDKSHQIPGVSSLWTSVSVLPRSRVVMDPWHGGRVRKTTLDADATNNGTAVGQPGLVRPWGGQWKENLRPSTAREEAHGGSFESPSKARKAWIQGRAKERAPIGKRSRLQPSGVWERSVVLKLRLDVDSNEAVVKSGDVNWRVGESETSNEKWRHELLS